VIGDRLPGCGDQDHATARPNKQAYTKDILEIAINFRPAAQQLGGLASIRAAAVDHAVGVIAKNRWKGVRSRAYAASSGRDAPSNRIESPRDLPFPAIGRKRAAPRLYGRRKRHNQPTKSL
jgi:hypothetical protein